MSNAQWEVINITIKIIAKSNMSNGVVLLEKQ